MCTRYVDDCSVAGRRGVKSDPIAASKSRRNAAIDSFRSKRIAAMSQESKMSSHSDADSSADSSSEEESDGEYSSDSSGDEIFGPDSDSDSGGKSVVCPVARVHNMDSCL